MQKSIEVEYWVIDEDGSLAPPETLVESSSQVEEEFVDCLFELKTPPCGTVRELRRTFAEQLAETIEAATDLDKRLVPLGTPINSGTIDLRPDDRTAIQRSVLGANLDYAKYCAGTHVHFEQRNVIDQLNVLIALDPALALCNSSPYFQGNRIANSARSYLYRKKCYEHLPKHGQLWEYADTVAQWKRRLDRRFEEFAEYARQRGVNPMDLEREFSPDDVVWTPVRLRDAMPTVEWRSPDATIPSELLDLVEFVESVMELIHHRSVSIGNSTLRISDTEVVLPEFGRLCDLSDAAMIDGLESPAVRQYLTEFGASVDDFAPLSKEFDSQYVSRADARQLRLAYADRLEADVAQLVRHA